MGEFDFSFSYSFGSYDTYSGFSGYAGQDITYQGTTAAGFDAYTSNPYLTTTTTTGFTLDTSIVGTANYQIGVDLTNNAVSGFANPNTGGTQALSLDNTYYTLASGSDAYLTSQFNTLGSIAVIQTETATVIGNTIGVGPDDYTVISDNTVVNDITTVAGETSNLNVAATVGVSAYNTTSNTSLADDQQYVNLGTTTTTGYNSSLDTTTRFGMFGEDLNAELIADLVAQDIRDATVNDVVGYVSELYTEIITEARNARAGTISEVVAVELAYQSGVTDERVVGPGIGGNSTVLDVVEGPSFVELIASTALAISNNDPAALAALKTGLPNPFDYGYDLDTGIFASEEDASLYAQARVANITNLISTGIDLVVTTYQVSQQLLISNPTTFTIQNADGTFQILPYTLQKQVQELNDPTTARAVVTAIQEAGGVIANADLSFANLERLVEINDLKTINSTIVIDEEILRDEGGAGGDLVTQGFANSAEVATNNPQTWRFVMEEVRPVDFPTYDAELTTEERAQLVEGLNNQIIRTVDSNITGAGSAIEKSNAIQNIIDSNGYGLGLDQDQLDYLNEGLASATAYATSYAAAFTLVNSALASIASIQQTDSSASVTQDRRSAADDLWNSLTPLEKQVARDTGLAKDLDKLLSDPFGIIDSGNIRQLDVYSTGENTGVQGAVDRAVAEFLSQNGTITEDQYTKIEDAVNEVYRVEQQRDAIDTVVPPQDRQNFMVKVRARDTSLSRAQSNAEPDSPESSASVTQYQNYAAALEILRDETGGKTASEWVDEGKLVEATPGSGIFSGTIPFAPGSSIFVPLTVSLSTINAQQALIEQTTQQRQGLLNEGISADTLDNPVNLEKAVAQQLPLADQVLSTTSAALVDTNPDSAGFGFPVPPTASRNQQQPQRQTLQVTSEQATAGSGSAISTTTLALVAAASAVAVTNADAVVATASNLIDSATSFVGGLFKSSNTTASASTTDTGDYGSDYTSEFALANFVGLDDIETSASNVNGSDIYEWPTGTDGSTPYDDDGNLNPGWELDEDNNPVYVGFDKTDAPADVPVQDIYQYPSGPNGETPYDDDGNLNPGWELDEDNNPVYVGSDYISSSLLDSANASREYASKLLAQQQATLEAQRKLINNGDWRVRLSLAPAADYLYNTPGDGTAGILEPLRVTNGVLFPYTPQIDTQYRAEYDSYSLTHSNYKGYFYKSSHTDAVNITATFTAQDTSEAEYLLAVIHFFRSVTKMFYGQDPERGAPPPLVYLTGLGEYQFNGHPCVVTNFNYTLPADVDYIRARSKNVSYSNLLQRRDRQSLPTNLLTSALDRLFNAGVTKGAIPETQAPPTLGLNSPTYVPTKMQITISLLPVQSRSQVSKQFSLKQFANGNLLKGGFW